MTLAQFVLEVGRGARLDHLAHVLGIPEAEVAQIRVPGKSHVRRNAGDFARLFAARHGRAPKDDEWPTPRKLGELSYEWQPPELAVMARLVGLQPADAIARVLTQRLQRLTGDGSARRTVAHVQHKAARLGLGFDEFLAALTVQQAAKRAGTTKAVIHQAIAKGGLRSFRIGQRIALTERALDEWKATRLPEPPRGWVKLWSIRTRLGFHSDHLAYHAKHERIPGARLCAGHDYYIPPDVAKDLLRRRRLGLPMPWNGWTHPSVARRSWNLWRRRRHPDCTDCRAIWRGVGGEPTTFAEFYERWLKIPETTKRHLTAPDGISSTQAQLLTGIDRHDIGAAARRGELKAQHGRGRHYVFRKEDVLAWVKSHASKATKTTRGRMTFKDAGRFLGGIARVRAAIRRGVLKVVRRWNGTPGVMRHEVAALRLRLQSLPVGRAARLCGVSVPTFCKLAQRTQGPAIWKPGERVQPEVLEHVRGRLRASWQLSIDQAADLLGRPRWYVERAIELGHLIPLRATGDARRVVLGRKAVLALKRRRVQFGRPRRRRGPSMEWLSITEAAHWAGVSVGVITRWRRLGIVRIERQQPSDGSSGRGWRYSKPDIEANARQWWALCPFKRRTPPAWLTERSAA